MASARKIIIIGATSGIGYEITQLYRKQGWRIGIAGRRTELLAKIRSEAPDQIETAQIDITCQDAPNKLAELIDKVGGMDVFLLSSGIGSQNRDLNPDIELSTVQTNTVGFTRMVVAAYDYLKKGRRRPISRDQFHRRYKRIGSRSFLFRNQALPEYLYRGTRPVGTDGKAPDRIHGYPPRICKDRSVEKR